MNFPEPRVSIVIPVHNADAYLSETLQSALSIHYSNFEIVLVDDGSTDLSPLLCQEWSDRFPDRIKILYQDNLGPSVARNQGIAKATGKYILPLDSDDKIHPDYVKLAVKQLEEDQDLTLVYCEAEKFGEKNCPWSLQSFSLEKLALDNMIFVSALFRKTDWETVGGFDPDFKWGWEDWEFWINLLKRGGKVHKLPLVGFYYRIRKGSRRKSTSKRGKELTIRLLNQKHPDFFHRFLLGKLRNPRGLSKSLNLIHRLLLPKSLSLVKRLANLNGNLQ